MWKDLREPVEGACRRCGKQIEIRERHVNPRKWCSDKCKQMTWVKRHPRGRWTRIGRMNDEVDGIEEYWKLAKRVPVVVLSLDEYGWRKLKFLFEGVDWVGVAQTLAETDVGAVKDWGIKAVEVIEVLGGKWGGRKRY